MHKTGHVSLRTRHREIHLLIVINSTASSPRKANLESVFHSVELTIDGARYVIIQLKRETNIADISLRDRTRRAVDYQIITRLLVPTQRDVYKFRN
jgi:hypothetical protein